MTFEEEVEEQAEARAARGAAYMPQAQRDDWNTPQVILDVVREVAGGQIGCDPCANAAGIVYARKEYNFLERGENGLVLPWESLAFFNPPYGRGLGEWTARAVEMCGVYDVASIGLLPSRTGTKWFQRDVLGLAEAICFISGRLKFLGAKDAAPFDTILPYWGPDPKRFGRAARRLGEIVYP